MTNNRPVDVRFEIIKLKVPVRIAVGQGPHHRREATNGCSIFISFVLESRIFILDLQYAASSYSPAGYRGNGKWGGHYRIDCREGEAPAVEFAIAWEGWSPTATKTPA
jgi:hypothetical protein